MIQKGWEAPQFLVRMPTHAKSLAAILWETLKAPFFLFITLFFIPSVLPSSAFCLESAGQILEELDAHYYYPQKQGLQKLSVRMEWEQLDVSSDSGKYLKNPSVEFFWENSPAGFKSAFELVDKSGEISEDRRLEILRLFQNYKEIVIPQTLVNKMMGHEGQIKGENKQTRLIEFTSPNPDAKVGKYSLMVDRKRKNVRRIRIERKDKPFEVVSDVRYIQKDGKWMIAESRSQFRVGEMDYKETTEYVYRRAGKFWLVGKMTQTLKTGDSILQAFVFRFRDYQVN